jgi:hypothetical protein
LGYQLLADAALSQDEDRGGVRGESSDSLSELLHRATVADQLIRYR